jgi:hypothetical protein
LDGDKLQAVLDRKSQAFSVSVVYHLRWDLRQMVDMPVADDRFGARSLTVLGMVADSKDGTQIGLTQIGYGPGLILVQGALGTTHNYCDLAQALSSDFTVYTPDKPHKRFFAGRALDAVRPDVADVAVWLDPIRGRPETDEVPLDPATLSGWPREFFASGQIMALRAPVHGPQRDALIAQIDAQLPLDYREFTKQMDDARVGECKIHGLTSVRNVALSSLDFHGQEFA